MIHFTISNETGEERTPARDGEEIRLQPGDAIQFLDENGNPTAAAFVAPRGDDLVVVFPDGSFVLLAGFLSRNPEGERAPSVLSLFGGESAFSVETPAFSSFLSGGATSTESSFAAAWLVRGETRADAAVVEIFVGVADSEHDVSVVERAVLDGNADLQQLLGLSNEQGSGSFGDGPIVFFSGDDPFDTEEQGIPKVDLTPAPPVEETEIVPPTGLADPAPASDDSTTVETPIAASFAPIYINEVYNHWIGGLPSSNPPNEYIELRSAPNAIVPAGTYLVAVEGDVESDPGTISMVMDLSGLHFGENGFIVILGNGHPYDPSINANAISPTTGIGFTGHSFYETNLGEFGVPTNSVSYLLIRDSEKPELGYDIDLNDFGPTSSGFIGGAVNNPYNSWAILDTVGILDGGADDISYANITFRHAFEGDVITGSTQINFENAEPITYVGRVGNSTGSGKDDWVGSSISGLPPDLTLDIGPLAGGHLNHIGRENEFFSQTFELGRLDGTHGFRIAGASPGDHFGVSVSTAGDFNGDGFDDVIVGSPGFGPGTAYVIFGGNEGFGETFDLAELAAGSGVQLVGEGIGDAFGTSVSGGGDYNGDGIGDVLVGAPNADAVFNQQLLSDAGAGYVVFGSQNPLPVGVFVAGLDEDSGVILQGQTAGEHRGLAVALTGDYNGAGLVDPILLGDPELHQNVFKGGLTREPETWLTTFNSWHANSIAVGGDFNGDGIDDILSGFDGGAGIRFGEHFGLPQAGPILSLGVATEGDQIGFSVSFAGDVNGDGFLDVIVGAPQQGPGLPDGGAGSSFVVFGSESGSLNFSSPSGPGGFEIVGGAAGDALGYSVSSAGDLNADGYDDLIVGAPTANFGSDPENDAGEVYVIFGGPDEFPDEINVSQMTPDQGFILEGVSAGDQTGYAVASAGDFNGDGFDDLIIGAPHSFGDDSGSAFVIYGQVFNTQISENATPGADLLIGTAIPNFIVGHGGADVINAGRGNDLIAVDDLEFRLVDGGRGHDTLRLTGSQQLLDLEAMPDLKIQSIEEIDLHDGGNSLHLGRTDVLNLSNESNTLLVRGTAGSVSSHDHWKAEGIEQIGGESFSVYTNGLATLKVSETIDQNDIPLLVDLSDLDAADGAALIGPELGVGFSVAGAGDVNGDGLDDVIVGMAESPDNQFYTAVNPFNGSAYVVFGQAGGLGETVDLATLDGTNGFRIHEHASSSGSAGYSVSSAGDFNGDGIDDLLVGRPNANGDSGRASVIYGTDGPFPAEAQFVGALVPALGGHGLIGGNAGDLSGFAVAGAGDVNGDGLADVLVGAPAADPDGQSEAGSAFLVPGRTSDNSNSLLGNFIPSQGAIQLDGANPMDFAGATVSGAGDVNGDGWGDFVIGAPGPGLFSGSSFVIFGSPNPSGQQLLAASSLGGFDGFEIAGGPGNGRKVSAAGDVNGDGFGDLIVSNPGDDTGQAWVVFGSAGPFQAQIQTNDLDGLNGFEITGVASDDRAGTSVASAGDVNGDGFDDLLIGAPWADPLGRPSAGETYLVFGKADGFSASFDLADLSPDDGIIFAGGIDGFDASGHSVDGAGDVNGDGFDDLIIGAPLRHSVLSNPGATGGAFVYYGRDFRDEIAESGSAFADNLVGSAGNDSFVGLGGEDAINGGAGDDLIDVPFLDFRLIDGGNGEDTLRISGASVELRLRDFAGRKIQNIEAIDLAGPGAKVLLTQIDVLNLSTHSNTLVVTGDASSSVFTADAWEAQGQEEIDGDVFDVFTNGEATLKVETPIDTSGFAVGLDLQEQNPQQAMKLIGFEPGGEVGFAVGGAGDLDGDGLEDLIISNPAHGTVFFQFGSMGTGNQFVGGPLFDDVKLTVSSDNSLGWSVSGAGDINGDGFGDALVGWPRTTTPGSVFSVEGGADFRSDPVLDLLDNGDELQFFGGASDGVDALGLSVSSAGDFNGDGFSDLLFGAPVDGGGDGSAYLIYGSDGNGFSDYPPDLGSLGPLEGFRIHGPDPASLVGRSVSGAGDVNGDGLDDILIGAPGVDGGDGEAYVIYGGSVFGSSFNLADLDGSNGFRILDTSPSAAAGFSVAGIGDFNGDGFDDIAIGAPEGGPGHAGITTIIHGQDNFGAGFNAAYVNGYTGIRLEGYTPGEHFGWAVAGVGDVNSDGFDDVVVGAPGASPDGLQEAGRAYLVFGSNQNGDFANKIDLFNLGERLRIIDGDKAGGQFGFSVAAAGDYDGDSFDDIIIGAPGQESAISNGEGWLLFGRDFLGQHEMPPPGNLYTLLEGTPGADHLTGTHQDNILVGKGGADNFSGGAGDDLIGVADLGFRRVDGGTGFDTLRLDLTNQHINLTGIDNNRIADIEAIDLKAGSGNSITISHHEVVFLSQTSNTLQLLGDASNAVSIVGGGFTQVAGGPDGFTTFEAGNARVEIQNGVIVNAPPVVLDLDGDGLEFLQNAETDAAFDFDGDGLAEQTAWVAPDDAFLVLDLDGDGLVSDRAEISFVEAVPGASSDLQALALGFDDNGDGMLDALDAAWEQLLVWQDANSDGVSQTGELTGILDSGIVALNLDAADPGQNAGDVIVTATSSYVTASGETRELGDVQLGYDPNEEAKPEIGDLVSSEDAQIELPPSGAAESETAVPPIETEIVQIETPPPPAAEVPVQVLPPEVV